MANERTIVCYHCRGHVNVPWAARSASCPLCFKGLILDDLLVRESGYSRLFTCGKITVEKKAKAITRSIEASARHRHPGHGRGQGHQPGAGVRRAGCSHQGRLRSPLIDRRAGGRHRGRLLPDRGRRLTQGRQVGYIVCDGPFSNIDAVARDAGSRGSLGLPQRLNDELRCLLAQPPGSVGAQHRVHKERPGGRVRAGHGDRSVHQGRGLDRLGPGRGVQRRPAA